MNLEPLGEKIVVVVLKQEDSFIPEHLTKDSLVLCKVLNVPEKTGKPSQGQTVLIPRNALREVNISDEHQCIVMIKDVYAIVTD